MKLYAVILAALCSALTANAQASFPQFEARSHNEGGKALKYRLLVPKKFQPGTSLPLIVWLHGSGEVGTDNTSPLRTLDGTFLANAETCRAFVMVPQCPPRTAWHAVGFNKPPDITEPARMVAATIAELHKEFGLDGRRIYLGGFSMGGCGTWEMLTRFPDLFAAGFPIAGPPGDRKALAPVIKHIPVWVFHGDKDNLAPVTMSRDIVAALRDAGGDVKYTEYAGGGHECARTLRDPKLSEWLLTQRRPAAPSFVQASVPATATLIVQTLPDGKTGTWTGEVERTRQGAARLPIDNVRYRLKPAKNAAPAIAELLAKIGNGQATGEYSVTGTIELADYAWLSVEQITVVKK